MRALRLALATVAVVFLLAAGALVAGPGLLPDERLRATAAALIGGAFDRPVEVAGPVRLALLPTPRLQAERLRIGSPEAAGVGLTAGRLDSRLELLPLLSGDFRFTPLDLRHAVLSAAVASSRCCGPSAVTCSGQATRRRPRALSGSVRSASCSNGLSTSCTSPPTPWRRCSAPWRT